MDIVELESSNGQLNKFMYGFDIEPLLDKMIPGHKVDANNAMPSTRSV